MTYTTHEDVCKAGWRDLYSSLPEEVRRDVWARARKKAGLAKWERTHTRKVRGSRGGVAKTRLTLAWRVPGTVEAEQRMVLLGQVEYWAGVWAREWWEKEVKRVKRYVDKLQEVVDKADWNGVDWTFDVAGPEGSRVVVGPDDAQRELSELVEDHGNQVALQIKSYVDRVRNSAGVAKKYALECVLRAKSGDWDGAAQYAAMAVNEESKWGDSPCYGPLLQWIRWQEFDYEGMAKLSKRIPRSGLTLAVDRDGDYHLIEPDHHLRGQILRITKPSTPDEIKEGVEGC